MQSLLKFQSTFCTRFLSSLFVLGANHVLNLVIKAITVWTLKLTKPVHNKLARSALNKNTLFEIIKLLK